MDVEAVVFLLRHRQFGEESPLRAAEPAPGPFDGGLGFGIHVLGRGADGIVMVAAHGDRA